MISSELHNFFVDHKLWGMDALDVAKASLAPLGLELSDAPIDNKFEIRHSDGVTAEMLYPYLYSESGSHYHGCFPHIDQLRNEHGNLQLTIGKLKPCIPHLLAPAGHLSKFFKMELPDDPKAAKKILVRQVLPPPPHAIQEVENQIVSSLTQTMCALAAPKEGLEGLWYHDKLQERYPAMPAGWASGHADERYFKKIGHYTFEIRDGVRPTDAILSFLRGPTVADCGNAIVAASYKAILDVVGAEKFDLYFDNPERPLQITQSLMETTSPLTHFLRDAKQATRLHEGTEGNRPLKPGDLCYFKGANLYPIKHPEGNALGWRVVYIGVNNLGEQLFMGHGFSKPLTEKEIIQLLIDEYNLERTQRDQQSLQKAALPDLFANPKYQKFYTITQEYQNSHEYFVYGIYAALTTRISPKLVCRLKQSADIQPLRRELHIRSRLGWFTLRSGHHVIF